MTSKIEWTDRTWNPTIGCAKVSAGCQNCDAERKAGRVARMQKGSPYLRVLGIDTGSVEPVEEDVSGRWNGRAVFLPERLIEPLRWRKPSRVFVDSMSDLFHEDITFDQIAAVFGVMAATPRHTYQVLTKRPERMVEFFRWLAIEGGTRPHRQRRQHQEPRWCRRRLARRPPPNVLLGVSVENQKTADERIPLLVQCPAALRFLSVEPLLGPVALEYAAFNGADSFGQLPGIGWVIVGGESGPNARPCHVGWIRSIVKQCRIAGVPVFVKQLGARPMVRFDDVDDKTFAELEAADMEAAEALRSGCSRVLRPKDRKGGDPSEWPQDLRVRQLPHQLPEK